MAHNVQSSESESPISIAAWHESMSENTYRHRHHRHRHRQLFLHDSGCAFVHDDSQNRGLAQYGPLSTASCQLRWNCCAEARQPSLLEQWMNLIHLADVSALEPARHPEHWRMLPAHQ